MGGYRRDGLNVRNDFPKMPLEFLWEGVFYIDVAPTALGFNPKFGDRAETRSCHEKLPQRLDRQFVELRFLPAAP